MSQEQLKKHVTVDKGHVEMEAKNDHESCLVSNATPHVMGPMDYVASSAEASLAHFLDTPVNGKPSATPGEVDQEVSSVQLTEERLVEVLRGW